MTGFISVFTGGVHPLKNIFTAKTQRPQKFFYILSSMRFCGEKGVYEWILGKCVSGFDLLSNVEWI